MVPLVDRGRPWAVQSIEVRARVREFLTGLAILLIGVLFAALVAPFLVDFNERRAFVEETLSRAAGTPVSVGGQISLRFLPFPVVKLERVTMGNAASGLAVTADHVSLDIATMPLLKGEIYVMEAVIDRPTVTVAISEEGRFPRFPNLANSSESSSAWPISIETLAVHDGALSLAPTRDAPPMRLTKLDLAIQAAALSGPWRVDGTGNWRGRPVQVRLTTGALDEAGLFRARFGLDRKGGGFRAELDGVIATKGDSGFDGKLRLEGDMAWPEDNDIGIRPVSLTSAIKLTGRSFDISAAEILAGGDEGGFKLTGSGNGRLGRDGGMVLLLDARQIDLDRTLKTEGRAYPPLTEVLSAWRGTFLASDEDLTPSLPVDVTLSVESVLAGGDTIKGLRLETHLDSEGVKLRRGEAQLPGGAKLTASGDIGLAEGGAFFGKASFTAKDFTRFGAWVDGEASGHAARFGEARDVSVEGDFALSASLMGASNLKIGLDKSSLTGLVRYSIPEEGGRSRLDAQLASQGFDLDQLPDLPMMAARLGAIDASIVVDARNVRATRMKDAHAGRVQFKARASEDGLVIDTLDIADLGGANVKASGRLTAVGERVDALVDAPDMAPLTLLFAKLFPGRVASVLSERAKVISPARFTVTAERTSDSARTIRLTFDGTAATTSLSGTSRMNFDDAGLVYQVDATASARDGVVLLQQAGLSVLPSQLNGSGRVTLKAKGDPQAGSDLSYDMDLAGVAATGTLTINREATQATGPFKINTADATPLLGALGFPFPDSTLKTPAQVTGRFEAGSDLIAFKQIDALVSGRKLSGALHYRPTLLKIEGDLKADFISLPVLASFVVGPVGDAVSGSLWPSTRFSEVGPPPLDLVIGLTADSVDTGFGVKLAKLSTQLAWRPDSLEFQALDARLFDAPLSGSLALRRQGNLATYLGKLSVKGVALADVFPRAGLGGSADVQFDGGGSGESLSAFAASLSGGGQMRVSGLTVPTFDLGAVAATTRALDSQRDPPDVRRVTDLISTGLNGGPLRLDELSAPLTASSGVMRFGPIDARQGNAGLQGSLSLDMRVMKLDARLVVDSKDAPKDWIGPPPQVILSLRGLVSGVPTRDIDATNLTNILTTRAVTRELARIEAQESDLRERGFFTRRLKVGRDLEERARRAAEEARIAEEARKAEEARLAEEAKRKAEAEEAQRKAAQDAETQRILDELKAKEDEEALRKKTQQQNLLQGVEQLLNNNSEAQSAP